MNTLALKLTAAITAVMLSLGLTFGLSSLPAVQAQDIGDQICEGANLGAGGECDEETEQNKINDVANTVINMFSLIIGIISVIVIIVAGLRYITSGGDSTKVGNARNQIVYAIVGIVVVLFAQTIVRFVVSKL